MTTSSPISERGALGRDFGWFWTAQATSAVGAQISEIAVPLLAVATLHASAGQVGLLGVARWVPFVLLALPLGVLLDRHSRRPLLVVADLARAAVTLAIVLLAVNGTLTLLLFLVLVTVLGSFTVVFDVGYQSFLPSVVPRDGLERANGRLQATASAAQVGGPGLGGLLVQALSAPAALLVHALTYLASAAALLRTRVVEARPAPSGRSIFRDLADGLGLVRRDRYLVSLAGFAGIYNLFGQWVMVLLTVHAVRELGLTAGHLGLALSLGATGAVVGAALAPTCLRRLGVGRLLIACAAVESVALCGLPLLDSSWPVWAVVTSLVVVFMANGAGTSMSSVVALSLRQLRTPDHMLGRVNATMRWLSYGTVAVGAGIGGLVGESVGTRAGITLGAMGTLVTVAWVAASPLRSVTSPHKIDPRRDAAVEGRAVGHPTA